MFWLSVPICHTMPCTTCMVDCQLIYDPGRAIPSMPWPISDCSRIVISSLHVLIMAICQNACHIWPTKDPTSNFANIRWEQVWKETKYLFHYLTAWMSHANMESKSIAQTLRQIQNHTLCSAQTLCTGSLTFVLFWKYRRSWRFYLNFSIIVVASSL